MKILLYIYAILCFINSFPIDLSKMEGSDRYLQYIIFWGFLSYRHRWFLTYLTGVKSSDRTCILPMGALLVINVTQKIQKFLVIASSISCRVNWFAWNQKFTTLLLHGISFLCMLSKFHWLLYIFMLNLTQCSLDSSNILMKNTFTFAF